MSTEIENQYLKHENLYKSLGESVKSVLGVLLSEEKIHSIDTRVKGRDSLLEKIERKENKYSSINEITDIVGIRIICFYSDDVDKIADIIANEFMIDKDNSVDKREQSEPEKFGYSSLHYVAQYNDKRSELAEYEKFKGLRFEIQIRTILQHSWAEIEHDSGYKSEREIPREIRRAFALLSGLLELADKEFRTIRDDLKAYEIDVTNKLKNKNEDILIDRISLSKFISISKNLNSLNSAILAVSGCTLCEGILDLDRKIKALDFIGIKFINEIDDAITQEFDLCVEIAKQFLAGVKAVDHSVGILYLAYAKIARKEDIDTIYNYAREIGITDPEYIGGKLLSAYNAFIEQ